MAAQLSACPLGITNRPQIVVNGKPLTLEERISVNHVYGAYYKHAFDFISIWSYCVLLLLSVFALVVKLRKISREKKELLRCLENWSDKGIGRNEESQL